MPRESDPDDAPKTAPVTGEIVNLGLRRATGYAPTITQGPARTWPSLGDVETKPITWTWWPQIPEGTQSILAGPQGTGKGMASMDVAARVTRGRHMPFSDDPPSAPGNVLWCESEDSFSQTIKPRAIAADADVTRIVPMTPRDFRPLSTTKGALSAFLRANEIRLVVFSPLNSFLFSLKNANSELEVRRVLEELQDAIEDLPCAILGLCHVNKKEGLGAIERVLGSVAYTAFVRSVMLCKKEGEGFGDPVRLVHAKHNLSGRGDDLYFQIVGTTDDERDQFKKVQWSRSEANIDVEGMFDRKAGAGEGAERRLSAWEWLVGFLREKGGSAPVQVIEHAAIAAGLKPETVKKAKTASHRRPGPTVTHRWDEGAQAWLWELDELGAPFSGPAEDGSTAFEC